MAGARSHRQHEHCPMRDALVALDGDDVARVLRDVAPAQRRQLFHALGLRLDPGRARGKAHQLVCSRLRTLPARAVHDTALAFVAGLGPDLLDAMQDDGAGTGDGTGDDDAVPRVQAALPELVERWSPGLARLFLSVLWETGALDTDDHATLQATLDGIAPSSAAPTDVEGEGTRFRNAEPRLGAGALLPAPPDGAAARGGPPTERGLGAVAGGQALPALVLRSVRTAAAATGELPTRGTDADAAAGAADPSPGAAACAAVAELSELDPASPTPWYLHGAAAGFGLAASGDLPAPAPEPSSIEALADAQLAGRLAALAESGGDRARGELVALVTAEEAAVMRIAATPLGPAVLGPAVLALVALVADPPGDPGRAAGLLGCLAGPPPEWASITEAVQLRAGAMLTGGDPVGAEGLLRAADEALTLWSAALAATGAEHGPDSSTELQRAATGLGLARAACRRARRDFAGALRLLEQIADDLLPAAARAAAARERVLAGAGFGGVDDVRLPRSERDRARLADRLRRVAGELDAAVALDPDHPAPRLLLGVLAVCRGDDAGAAQHLALAEGALSEAGAATDLVADVRVHRAVAELRLLEPGTDEAAYQAITDVLAAGHDPGAATLGAAADALDAHGSPRAGPLAAAAALQAPGDTDLARLVGEHARRGNPEALAAARRLAAGESLGLAARYRLLEAALAGAGRLEDAAATEAVVGEIEEVLARACDPDLDACWAAALAADEHLRALLEPAQADAIRVQVLRRAGQVDDARALARALFHRVAAGSVTGFDGAELLALLTELGTNPADLATLSALVPERAGPGAGDPASALMPLAEPVLVLFVGGDETQARYAAGIDEDLAARHDDAVRVEWFHPGWGSGWPAEADRIEARYPDAGAVVLMTLVRTLLGRRLRRTAGEAGLPWIACTGHGRASLARAIEHAAAVARTQQRRAAR